MADLARLLAGLDLEDHREFILGIARPTVEILPADDHLSSRSRFGGSPDLPADFKWPEHERGPYRFLGQANLADIPKGLHGLPADGLLSFFWAYDESGETFWGDPDYVRVYRFDNRNTLQPIKPPPAVQLGATTAMKFQLGADVPPWPWDESAAKKWPIDEFYRDSYWDLRCRLHPTGRYLLGYPFNTTLGYDPTPGPEWRSLLTLKSDEKMAWCWHDGDWLVTFIEEQRLRMGDFSCIKADEG